MWEHTIGVVLAEVKEVVCVTVNGMEAEGKVEDYSNVSANKDDKIPNGEKQQKLLQ